ncbi:MAG: relaxase [Planctomycetota bacterium]|nr:MAG: relaxase [Planctomycetota bacterium]
MILKGSQRAGGADLALHLMNEFDNERVELAQVRGTVADDLYGALAEVEAIAAGTRCNKPLYSLSINPPQPLTRHQYRAAIERIEHGLGLTGQPRAVIYHVKNGREHCHVVWSRIDGDRMRAIHISHDRMKLRTLARDLGREFGLSLPEGLAKDLRQERSADRQMTLAEKRQAENTGITPEARRAEITKAYRASDSADSFRAALTELGYELARGDRRGFVVVDRHGDVHSLARQIEGVKTRELTAKLAPLTPAQLPSAEQARSMVRERRKAADDVIRSRVREGAAAALKELELKQAARRRTLLERQQTMLTVHASERLALSAAQHAERVKPFNAAAMRVVELIQRVPGLRSVLAPILSSPSINLAARHTQAQDALRRRHAREAAMAERRADILSKLEAKERASLRSAVTRKLRNEERRRATHRTSGRSDQTVANTQNHAEPSLRAEPAAKASAGTNAAEGWKERADRLAQNRGASRKRKGPGYRLKRDDP